MIKDRILEVPTRGCGWTPETGQWRRQLGIVGYGHDIFGLYPRD